uniref:Cyanocobalamin reductase (cyanide-eliminating) n=1 Tax=Eutreptiella gymnastica TaxID=73025 RepID=A0A7S1JBW8_9EUGL|mmetsp:Transcript_82054/g.144944  ORF Transcript_82054/g.144944 Transcript_82054/m.144944 type:complete len:226 (+) Transcript_82054:3-680(+)
MIHERNLPLQPLTTFGRSDGRCLAFLVGNTKEVWPKFKTWLNEQGEHWPKIQNPFDTYTETSIRQATAESFETQTDLFWAADEGERLVSFQRVAEVASVAFLDTALHLSVHPKFGAWVSWRALVVVDSCPKAFGLPELPPHPLPCPIPKEVRDLAAEKSAAAMQQFNAVSGAVRQAAGSTQLAVWRLFLEIRDLVEIGRDEWRFGPEQLEYHYTKNISILQPAGA